MVEIRDPMNASPFGAFMSPGGETAALMQTAIAVELMRELMTFLAANGLFGPQTQGAVQDFLGGDPRTTAMDPAGIDRDALVEYVMNRLAQQSPARSMGAMRAPQLGQAQACSAGMMRAGDLQRADDARMRSRRSPVQSQPQVQGPAPAANAPAGPAQVVPAQKTPLTGSQASEAIRTAWVQRYGTEPSRQTLAVLTAQWSLETGRGRSMMNYNFGGIKGTGPSGLTTEYGTREGSGANEVHIRDRFRAYNNAAEGASDYLALLERRFPQALDAARQGDPEGFVHALKARGYFTGDETAYVRNVRGLTSTALAQGFDAIGSRPQTQTAYA